MRDRNIPGTDDWGTPPYIYDPLHAEFGFTFDPCPLNNDLQIWDGLKGEWKDRNFINPPYSKDLKPKFILKAIEESKKGKLCVMIIPVSTSTRLFHEHMLPNLSEPVRFFKGRIKFIRYDENWKPIKSGWAMHDSMLVIFGNKN